MKKPKESGKEDIFAHIRQAPRPTLDPISVDKFLSVDGQRMTRAYYASPIGNNHVESAEKWMAEARRFPEILVGPIHWHFILPWLENEDAVLVGFWVCFNCETAGTERRKAVNGLKSVNRTNERVLIGIAHEYKGLSLQQWGFELDKDERPSILAGAELPENDRIVMMAALKEKMVDWVLEAIWNDHEAPKRLHELLKDKNAVRSEYSDQPTVNGRIFNAFVRELTANWSLPTKKRVRREAGLGDKNEDYATASRAFDLLGLVGLPEG
jgi:hypothetical protein